MGTCNTVPIHTIRQSPRPTTSLTRPENFESPSSTVIVSLRSRKLVLHSRPILRGPYINCQYQIIEPLRIWIRVIKLCRRYCEPHFRGISAPSKHGEQRPTQRSCATNHMRGRSSTTSSFSKSRTGVTSFYQRWGNFWEEHQQASYSFHWTLSRSTLPSNSCIFRKIFMDAWARQPQGWLLQLQGTWSQVQGRNVYQD